MELSSNNQRHIGRLLILLLIAIAITNCNFDEKKEHKQTDHDLLKRPDMSELALLMRRMDKLTTQWKEAVEKGDYTSINFPDWLEKIHSAEATDPSEINEIYHTMADAWIKSVRQFKEATVEEKYNAFNSLVSNCINCHQHFCQGPISRIKKLYIERQPMNVSNR